MDNESPPSLQEYIHRTGPATGDAFGALLMACWESGVIPHAVLELIERDDGYMDWGDLVRYFSPPETWSAAARWGYELARGRVLDIGAGAGRQSLPLQSQGLDVTALDVSPLAAQVCRLRGLRRVIVGTVYDLQREGAAPFDTFLMYGNNLGLLGGADEAPRLLRAMAALAAPGAIVVGEGTDPYLTDNEVHLRYHQRNRALGRMSGQIRIRVRYRDMATPFFDYLFVSIGELEGLLVDTPWRLEEVRQDGPFYVAVLRLS